MFSTDELFDNNFSFISSFISLQSIFSKKKNKKLLRAYFWVGAYFWEALTFGGGAYYRSLISSLQQMRLLLGGAYYRGALIIGSLRYVIFGTLFILLAVSLYIFNFHQFHVTTYFGQLSISFMLLK